MENYLLNNEMKDELNYLVDTMYDEINNSIGALVFLDLVPGLTCEKVDFINQFHKLHNEIRNGPEAKIRHFILMKNAKITKENTNSLPLLDIISSFDTEVVKNYWNFVHEVYVILECSLDDHNETVTNTLAIEIAKRNAKDEEERIKASNNETSMIIKKQHSKDLKQKIHEKQKIPSMSDLMSQMGDNPEMADMLSTMTGGKTNQELDDMMKHAFNDNPEYADMFHNFMDQMNNTNENGEVNLDVESLVKQFMPDLDTNSKINSVLVNKIIKDIIYVFSKESLDKTVKERLIDKIQAYQRVFESGALSPMDMVGSLIKITSTESLKNQITEIDMVEIVMVDMISIATDMLPKEMMEQFGDLSNLGSGSQDINGIMSMFTGMTGGKMAENIVEEELTEDQEKELEAYYDSLMIDNA